ncbi:MAG: F0F1 ATP synthase subunit gamma [Methylococcaceae bacterium]
MADSISGLRHQIDSATDLASVVRTMKTLAASNISHYEQAVTALDDYYRTLQLGLIACFRENQAIKHAEIVTDWACTGAVGAVVFGSDQGLVGQFNESLAEFVSSTFSTMPCEKKIWSVGERVQTRLADMNLNSMQLFVVPSAIQAITALIGELLLAIETQLECGEIGSIYLFHNRPQGVLYQAVSQCLLPLDAVWQTELTAVRWTTNNLPEIIGGRKQTLKACIREYLFVSLFRCCTQSLASENASRLAAMQRAEKNIAEHLEELQRDFHRLRQNAIDAELFDVISGFEALVTGFSKS